MIKKEMIGKTNNKLPKGAIILVFLFLAILFLILMILIFYTKIRVEVYNFKFSSIRSIHTNKNYKIVIKLCVFNKIPILKFTITKAKLKKININEKIKKFNKKVMKDKNNFDKNLLTDIKNIKLEINKVHLIINIGTENTNLTSFLVVFISTIFSFIFSKKMKKYNKQKYKIIPIYNSQNVINILISGIFEIKMIHIINIIYILTKKEGVRKNERTSNRRSYDYSYE